MADRTHPIGDLPVSMCCSFLHFMDRLTLLPRVPVSMLECMFTLSLLHHCGVYSIIPVQYYSYHKEKNAMFFHFSSRDRTEQLVFRDGINSLDTAVLQPPSYHIMVIPSLMEMKWSERWSLFFQKGKWRNPQLIEQASFALLCCYLMRLVIWPVIIAYTL